MSKREDTAVIQDIKEAIDSTDARMDTLSVISMIGGVKKFFSQKNCRHKNRLLVL